MMRPAAAYLMHIRALVLSVAAICGSACEDTMPIGPTPQVASVNFFYESIIPPDTPFDPQSIGCIRSILPFTIHLTGEWNDFRVLEMRATADGLGYRGVASDVPIGDLHTIVMIDPAMCNVDQTTLGAVTQRVSANGVLLTTVTPVGAGPARPGLSFRVAADGTVTP
jgi:hypothetical protein